MEQTLNIPSAGIGDTVTKVLKKFGVTSLVSALQVYLTGTACNEPVDPQMSKCALRAATLNELIEYRRSPIKVRFLKDWVKRENVSRSNPPVMAIVFTAKAGDEVEVKKGHAAYVMLLWLAEHKFVEEIK